MTPSTERSPGSLVPEHALVDGTRIAHGVHGSGEPLVLVHGTPSSSWIWRDVYPALIDAGYRVHLLDLLGFGLSERPWDPAIDTSVSAQAEILAAMFDVWGLADAHLIAHDIGGSTGLRFGVFHPERTRTLTVLDPCTFDSWPSPRTREQMAAGLGPLIDTPEDRHRERFRDWLRSAVVDEARFADGSLDVFLDYISGPIGQASLFQHQVRHYDAAHTMDIAGRLVELGEKPFHVLWGAADAWQHVDWAERLRAAVPGAVLNVVPDAGHFLMEDRPEEVARLLIGFLRDHPVDGEP